MEEFLEQQRKAYEKAYEEMMKTVPVNAEALPLKEEASGGHSETVIANEPPRMEHDHYQEVYAVHRPLIDRPSEVVIMTTPGEGGKAWHKTLTSSIARWFRGYWFKTFSLVLVFSMCAHLILDVHCEMKQSLLALISSSHPVAKDVMHDYFKDGNIDSPIFEAWRPPFCTGNGMTYWKVANLIAFTCEICLRCVYEKQNFMSSRNRWWNVADIVLLVVNHMEYGSHDLLGVEFDPRWKAVNVLRMLRIMRVFLYFPTLANMLYALLACEKALRCAIFFIVFYTMGFAVFFMQVALYYLEQHKNELRPTEFESMVTNWNGIFDSSMSLVYAVTGGTDWKELAEPFFHMGATGWPGWPGHILGSIWLTCFTLYVTFTTMGLLNVLVGVFVSQAENLANVSIDYAIKRAGLKKADQEKDASMLFSRIQSFVGKNETDGEDEEDDPDGTDNEEYLTVSQIREACDNRTIRSLYAHLDIDLMNPDQMLKTFDHNRNSRVDRSEFITGCMRLQGPAKPVEVQHILELVVQMNKKLNDMVPEDRQLATVPIH